MSKPFSEFTGQFFWDFKMMDNVNYNFQIIEHLYAAKKVNYDYGHFNKPIIILIMAIIECSLYDFIKRINQHRNDSFPNITQSIIAHIRGANETDELRILIPRIRSQNLLRASVGDSIYDDLDHLRKVRNRVHIQNKYGVLDRDEYMVFTDRELIKAQECLKKVYEILCNVYPRWQNQPIPMSDFPQPWL
jgi:hypothetical protein